MVQETIPSVEFTTEDTESRHITYYIDPNTLLFQTYKSEDVSVIQNRITLLEIHELLMHINLILLPKVKHIQRAFTLYSVILLFTAIITLIMILLQDIGFLKVIAYNLIAAHLWVLTILIIKKMTYSRVIGRIIQEKKEFYTSKGVKWVFKNYYFRRNQGSSCWLELHLTEQTTTEGTERDLNPNVITFAKLHQTQKTKEFGAAKKFRTAFNLTLGQGASKTTSFQNAISYTAIDVGVQETFRVRKSSLDKTEKAT